MQPLRQPVSTCNCHESLMRIPLTLFVQRAHCLDNRPLERMHQQVFTRTQRNLLELMVRLGTSTPAFSMFGQKPVEKKDGPPGMSFIISLLALLMNEFMLFRGRKERWHRYIHFSLSIHDLSFTSSMFFQPPQPLRP